MTSIDQAGGQVAEEELMRLKEAAKRGDLEARMDLARMYAEGDGVTTNLEEAIHWYRLAADHGKGDSVACFALGRAYEFGRGVTQDWEQAAYWYRNSAEQYRSQFIKALSTVRRAS